MQSSFGPATIVYVIMSFFLLIAYVTVAIRTASSRKKYPTPLGTVDRRIVSTVLITTYVAIAALWTLFLQYLYRNEMHDWAWFALLLYILLAVHILGLMFYVAVL